MSNVGGFLVTGGVYCGTNLVGGWAEAWLPDFAECICLKPLDGFSLFEVLWHCLELKFLDL